MAYWTDCPTPIHDEVENLYKIPPTPLLTSARSSWFKVSPNFRTLPLIPALLIPKSPKPPHPRTATTTTTSTTATTFPQIHSYSYSTTKRSCAISTPRDATYAIRKPLTPSPVAVSSTSTARSPSPRRRKMMRRKMGWDVTSVR